MLVFIVSSYRVIPHLLLRRSFSGLISVWNTKQYVVWRTFKISLLTWKLSGQELSSPRIAAAWREYFSALTSAISSWTSGRSCRKRIEHRCNEITHRIWNRWWLSATEMCPLQNKHRISTGALPTCMKGDLNQELKVKIKRQLLLFDFLNLGY